MASKQEKERAARLLLATAMSARNLNKQRHTVPIGALPMSGFTYVECIWVAEEAQAMGSRKTRITYIKGRKEFRISLTY